MFTVNAILSVYLKAFGLTVYWSEETDLVTGAVSLPGTRTTMDIIITINTTKTTKNIIYIYYVKKKTAKDCETII